MNPLKSKRINCSTLSGFSKVPESQIDISYGRLLQIKKDFHDLQNAFENVTRFGLSEEEVAKISNLQDIPPQIKDIVNHPLVLAAANLKTAYSKGLVKDFNLLVNEQIPINGNNPQLATMNADQTESSAPPSPSSTVSINSGTELPKLPEIEDQELLKVVFTHSSAANSPKYDLHESNERLEYIGDSVLNFIVSDLLYERFPEYQEGLLSTLRAAIVCNKTLIEWSLAYGFDKKLVSEMDISKDHPEYKKLYADVFEAYIGGLYMGFGKDLSRIKPWLSALADIIIQNLPKKDSTSELATSESTSDKDIKMCKEDLYKLFNPIFIPEYILYDSLGVGTHTPVFKVACVVKGDVLGVGEGRNKKDAGSRAAYDALHNNISKVEKYVKFKDLVKCGGAEPPNRTVSVMKQIEEGIYDVVNPISTVRPDFENFKVSKTTFRER